MIEQYLIIRFLDGRMGAVLPADLADPEKSPNFKGAHIVGWESGEPYHGPTTAEGMARKAEREAEPEDVEAEPEPEPEPEHPRVARRARDAKD